MPSALALGHEESRGGEMSEEEHDVYLEQWVPSERLIHATLSQHIEDPWLTQELFEGDGGDLVQRTPWTGGTKRMLLQEERARRYDFFIERQPKWSTQFVDQLLSFGMSAAKVDHPFHCFRTLWVDGAHRQSSPEMMLDELELVVALPFTETRFRDDGVFGGIVQRSFR